MSIIVTPPSPIVVEVSDGTGQVTIDVTGAGSPGPRGSRWFAAAGAPAEDVDGAKLRDFYLDTLSGDVYELSPTGWIFQTNIHGADGEDGTDGADSTVPGPPNVLTVGTVETLEPGSDATVSIDGDSPSQVVSFGIPKGADGEGGSQTWDTLTGKPDTFPPSAHTHLTSQVDGLDSALAGKVDDSELTAEASARSAADTALDGRLDAVEGTLPAKADLVGGQVPTSQIPAVALTTGQAVANRAAMLALSNVQPGDFVAITGTADKGTYILTEAGPSSSFSSWLLLNVPTDVVQSVNGQNGTVVLSKSDVGLGSVDNTSDANKPVSTPQAASIATRAPRALPSYAPASSNAVFDPSLKHYNVKESNTRRLRAALGKAANGGLGEIMVISDSGGAGATNGIIPTYDRLRSWPMAMRDEFASRGIPSAGTGLVRAQDATQVDVRWAFTGTWVGATTFRYSTTPGSTATFTTDKAGATAAVKYTDPADGSVFTISVNGATSGAGFVTVNATGPFALKTALANLNIPAGSTIKLTLTSGVIYLLGIDVYSTSGLLVHNLSQSGATASGTGDGSWSANGSSNPGGLFTSAAVTVTGSDPGAVFIALGGNDKQGGSPASDATISAAITTIRNRFPNSDVVLVAQQQLSDSLVPAARWESYVGSLYALADTLDVPLVDVRARVGDYNQTVAAGLTTDGQGHFLAPGNVSVGRNIAGIVPVNFASVGFIDIQRFDGPATAAVWTKPIGAKTVDIVIQAPGGSGGGGKSGAAGVARPGGGAGGAGGRTSISVPASALSDTLYCTVAAAPSGGAGGTAGGNGTSGPAAGDAWVSASAIPSADNAIAGATGGNGGGGAATTTTTGGSGGIGSDRTGGTGGTSTTTGLANIGLGGAGSGGGPITAADSPTGYLSIGGAYALPSNTAALMRNTPLNQANGVDASADAAGPAGLPLGGTGGPASITSNGGNGGAGIYGGGGGGGGAALNAGGFKAGDGGKGGEGFVVITSHL